MLEREFPLSEAASARPIRWIGEKRADEPVLCADVDGDEWLIVYGDFPAEPVYLLYVNQHLSATFNDWPRAWSSLPSR